MSVQIRPFRRSKRSTRVAAPIRQDYWLSLGYSDRMAKILFDHSRSLTSAADKELCSGSKSYLNLGSLVDYDAVIPAHDIFLPHWKKFAQKLHQYEGLRDFAINCVQLDQSILKMIVPKLHPKNLVVMEFSYNKLDGPSLSLLASCISENSTMTHLRINYNKIDDLNAATSLSRAMASHPALVSVDLESCDLGKNIDVIAVIADGTKNIKHVDLSSNYIDSSGAYVISTVIAKNPECQHLNLRDNEICDISGVSFLEGLKRNTNLHGLCLLENKFSLQGKSHIYKALFDTTNLKTLRDSNHTCCLQLRDADVEEERISLINSVKATEQKKLLFKCYRALYFTCESCVNINYLNEIPLEHIPRILELMQKEMTIVSSFMGTRYWRRGFEFLDNAKGSLDRVYHILRNWKMPILYQSKETVNTKICIGCKKRKYIVMTEN